MTNASSEAETVCSVQSSVVDEVCLALQKANRKADRNYVEEVCKVALIICVK